MANRSRILVSDNGKQVRMTRKDFLKFCVKRGRGHDVPLTDFGSPEEPEDTVDVTEWDEGQYMDIVSESLA